MVDDSVHTLGVDEVKLTPRPDEADALTVIGAAPSAWFANGPNEMVWLAAVTEKL
jgi:hypothetical protein